MYHSGLNLPSLPDQSLFATDRTVVVRRRGDGESDGDFGFSLRKAVPLGGDGGAAAVVFVVVDEARRRPATGHDLLPGDVLLSVNDRPVEGLSLEEMAAMINQSADGQVRLTVRTVAQVNELLQLSSSALSMPNVAATAVASTTGACGDSVWLSHKDGYAGASVLQRATAEETSAKVEIKLHSNGAVFTVDSGDIEKVS